MILNSAWRIRKINLRVGRLFVIGLILSISLNTFSMNDTYCVDNNTVANCTLALSECTTALVQMLTQSSSPNSPFGTWTDWNLEVFIEIVIFGIMTNILGDMIAASKPMCPWPIAYCFKGSKKLCLYLWKKITGNYSKSQSAPPFSGEKVKLEESHYALQTDIIKKIGEDEFNLINAMFQPIGLVLLSCVHEKNEQDNDQNNMVDVKKVCQVRLLQTVQNLLNDENKHDLFFDKVSSKELKLKIGVHKYQSIKYILKSVNLIINDYFKKSVDEEFEDEQTKPPGKKYNQLLQAVIDLLIEFHVIEETV